MAKILRYLNALQLAFLVAIGCLVDLPALASTEMIDDAFNYPAGAYSDSTWQGFQIVSDNCKAGNCAVIGGGYSIANAEAYSNPLPIGQQSFWVYLSGAGDMTAYWKETTNGYTSPQYGLNFHWDGANYLLKTNGTTYTTLSPNNWYHIVFDWDCTNRNSYDGEWRVSADGGANFSGYQAFDTQYHSHWNGLKSIITWTTSGSFDGRLDTFGNPTPPVIGGFNPILTPTTPPQNVSTLVDLDDVAMAGTLQIPTANGWIWDHLIVNFYKQNSIIPARSFAFSLGDLVGGQSTTYSATTTIPFTSSGNNFFKVQYSLTGRKYIGSSVNNTTIHWPLLIDDNTWVSDSVGAPPASQITLSTLPAQDALEDCGAYSGIDAGFCNFKNFIAGAFLPTNEAIDQLNSTMDGFKTKFPMNYANAITETLTTIGAGVSDTSGFSFTLYGHSGTVDTSIFSKDLGSGVTVGGTIKLILTFLVLVVFLIWGINYMHRIFK